MANLTLVEDFRRLSMTNREYGRNRDRWTFLLDSFVGGDDYRRAAHLTKYVLEQDAEYNARLKTTPLDNHCSSVVSTYMSFLFRNDIERDFGGWEGSQDVESFLADCDYEGRSYNSFMKDVAQWASVFGHCWMIMTKPNVGAQTLGQEQAMGVRPYVNLMSPLVVNDWTWERHPNGQYELSYLKYIEEVVDKITVLKEWTKDTIKTWILDSVKEEAHLKMEEPNTLGIIPAVLCYNRKSMVRGQGVSDISDIADVQKMIYNLTSEIEQSIRLDGHPSLVVPPTAQLGSGAGALIVLQDGSDPGLNPYYLQTSGANIGAIQQTIDKLIESINTMANTGGVRTTKSQVSSGVALQTEFELLNARLSEKADSLELAEEQLWKIFGLYQGKDWNGAIKYPDSFSIRDIQREYNELVTAKNAATSPEAIAVIDYRVRELLDDPNLPDEPATHVLAQGYSSAGPQKTGPSSQAGARPRRYFSSTTTGLE
jgi:hypothetical protein